MRSVIDGDGLYRNSCCAIQHTAQPVISSVMPPAVSATLPYVWHPGTSWLGLSGRLVHTDHIIPKGVVLHAAAGEGPSYSQLPPGGTI